MLRIKVNNAFVNERKNIVLPLPLSFVPGDYDEQRQELIDELTFSAINQPKNNEKIKFTKSDRSKINIVFNFNGSGSGYEKVGFTEEDKSFNGFKKSFYRLYFYNSDDDKVSRLLFTEDVNITNKNTTSIDIDRIYWYMDDPIFKKGGDRELFMDARFFNAKNGKTHKFVTSIPNGKHKIIFKNPNSNNGYYFINTNDINLIETK